MIEINKNLMIPEDELVFSYARSPGPGGQNVNKVATKATLYFDVAGSPSLSERQREMVFDRLSTRITSEGVLQITRSRHRTQSANRRAAIEQFVELMADALTPRKVRKKTRPSRAANERRLQEKSRRGKVKAERRRRFRPDAD